MRSMLMLGAQDATTAAICFRFAHLGYGIAVIMPDTEQACRQWQSQMSRIGCDVTVIACDPGRETSIAPSFFEMPVEWRSPDVLIHQATRMGSRTTSELLMHLECQRIVRVISVTREDVPGMSCAVVQSEEVLRCGKATRNTIRVGHVGDRNQADASPFLSDAISADMLHKRVGQPYEVAVLAAFLASDEAVHINGATIDVHTGRYMS